MTDNEPTTEGATQAEAHPTAETLFDPVTVEDLASVDINALTEGVRRLDRHALLSLFADERRQANDVGNHTRARVFNLLAALMGMHLQIESEGDPFGLQWTNGQRRTMLPFDVDPPLAELLATIAPDVVHPTLRARLADVAYEAGIRRAGRVAIEAYCEIAIRFADGRIELQFPDIPSRAMDLIKPIERAFMINARVAKRGSFVEPITTTVQAAFDHCLAERAFFAIVQVGRRAMQAKVLTPEAVARHAETLAASAVPGEYELAVRETWLLAADAYERAGNAEASKAAAIKAIEQTLAMAETVTQSSAKAHWVKQAMREFRARGDCRERVDELKRRLRDLQDASLDEFGSFEVPLEGIQELRAKTHEEFATASLPEAMRSVIGFLIPDNVDELKQVILEQARAHPLTNLMGASYSDAQGREVARGDALDLEETPPEIWFKEHCIRHQQVVRRYRVHGQIEPARHAVRERFSISEQHMTVLVQLSSFVPAGHENIFALGFARLWQGDYVSAAHFLLPQVENSLRHILDITGRDIAKMDEEGLEGDRPLNVLLTYFQAELEPLIGRDMIWELDALLAFRPGPALRNELAHGKLVWNQFFSDEAITACWLVYLLTVAPLLRYWDSHVVPALAGTAGIHQP